MISCRDYEYNNFKFDTTSKFDEEKEYVIRLIHRELGQVKTNVQTLTEAISEMQAEIQVSSDAGPALKGTRIDGYVNGVSLRYEVKLGW